MNRISLFTSIFIICINNAISKIHNPKNFLICNNLNCPKARGVCTRDNKCICIDDYITLIEKKDKYGDYHCNYLAANQAKVFISEFLIGFGVGHFFLGHFLLASIKFLFTLTAAITAAIYPCIKNNNKSSKIYTSILAIFGLIYVIWQIIDGILIACNYYKDSNGVSMI